MSKFSWSNVIIFTIVIGLIGSLLHFVYELSGKITAVGLFSAINESTWEHTKMAFMPMLVFWLLLALRNHRKHLPWTKAVVAGIWSTLASLAIIMLLYYFYTHALSAYSIALDIGLFFCSIFIAMILGAHIYNRTNPRQALGIAALAGFAILFVLYMVFTLTPPQLPLFAAP